MANDESNVYLMTDEDVFNEQKRMNNLDQKELNTLIKGYCKCISNLINLGMQHANDFDEEVDFTRAREIINLLPIEEKFIRTKGKIWEMRNYIMTKDEKYFLNRDYSKHIRKDKNKVIIESLIAFAKEKYPQLNNEQKKSYWKLANQLLHYVCMFKKMMHEYVE